MEGKSRCIHALYNSSRTVDFLCILLVRWQTLASQPCFLKFKLIMDKKMKDIWNRRRLILFGITQKRTIHFPMALDLLYVFHWYWALVIIAGMISVVATKSCKLFEISVSGRESSASFGSTWSFLWKDYSVSKYQQDCSAHRLSMVVTTDSLCKSIFPFLSNIGFKGYLKCHPRIIPPSPSKTPFYREVPESFKNSTIFVSLCGA